MKMFSNNSPFSFLPNSNKNYLSFKHQDQSNHYNLPDPDYFSLDNNNQKTQCKTKQRFAFYNNDSQSQIKQCLDYFQNSDNKNSNINLLYYTGDIPLNFNKNKNDNDVEMKIKKSSFNESINSSMLKNSQNKDFNMNEDENNCSCPPPCKRSNNSCFSDSTFNSSYNSNINCCYNSIDKIDSLTNEIGNMQIDNGKNEDAELINENVKGKKENNNTLRRIQKILIKKD